MRHDDDLARLEATQRAEEVAPGALVRRQNSRVRIPEGGSLPRSAALLERLYEGGLVPREKKELVIDTRASQGPFMASIDDAPMVLLDACSQIATLTHGFQHPAMVRGIFEGRFDGCLWANPDSTVGPVPELEAFARLLLAHAPAGLEHCTFVCAGGAEANEKALRIARLHAPSEERRRVLAFEHSFHGRTLVALGATWNPHKRGPFEMPGHEALFCPAEPEALRRTLDERGHELYAALVEPMMAEGGDVHLERELLAAIRELTRAHGIPLVVDEVQTGFGTGGSREHPEFFWWSRLGLGSDPRTAPDLLTCAKKAGLGVVLSRFPDPEPVAVNVVSALRGLIHAETAADQYDLEALVRPRLAALADEFPQLVLAPRFAGSTFAFDLPDALTRDALVNQRFQLGFMTYGAGARTIRFRLNAAFGPRTCDDLFERIRVGLRRVASDEPITWRVEGLKDPAADGVVVEPVAEADWPAIMAIEQSAYEPERADSEAWLRTVGERGIGFVARRRSSGEVLGFCFGGPLDRFPEVAGPDADPLRGTGEAFYSADVTVSAAARGLGVGRLLKEAQLGWAREHGFRFCTGRNREDMTHEMSRLNASYGAWVDRVLEAQYGGDARAEYYRLPLAGPRVPVVDASERDFLDFASGLHAPLGPAPACMATRELVGPTTSRLNLSNWATPDLVHYLEHLRLVLPRGCGHLYVTSSRDETVDKALRCLRLGRPEARIAVGLEGGYVGHTTAACRAISDPRGFAPRFDVFGWPRIPHPAEDPEGMGAALGALVREHGAAHLFAVVAEVVGERSGLWLGGHAGEALARACREHDVPLVLVETASGGYRAERGPWGVDALSPEVVPDLVLWYPGGQLGHVFVGDRYYVDKPITLISTWDGDEVSMIRTHETMRAAWRIERMRSADMLGDVLEGLCAVMGPAAPRIGGRGLYRTLSFDTSERAAAFHQAAAEVGLELGRGLPHTVTFVPALDLPADEAVREALKVALVGAAVAVDERGG